MRWLLVGRGREGVEGAQLEGFDMYAGALRAELGLEVVRQDAATLAEARAAIAAHADVDAALVMPSWAEPAERLIAWCREARALGPRLVLLDYYAQTSSPHLGAAPHVDLYVKRQALRDRGLYRRELASGYVFTEFLARDLGWDLAGWRFGSVLPAGHEGALVVGWSLGVLRRNRLLARLGAAPWALRPLDVNARVGGEEADGPQEWYQRYRALARERLQALAGRLRVSHSGRVTRRRYLAELLRSRVVVSPFGWGEVCFRDYEAVACGCLLVKPSMRHVETRPDVFVDHETYLPLRWDLADLEEVVRRALEEPRRARRIAENGRRRLRDYFERGGFVADVARVADALAGRRRALAA
ncbi:MAG: glycosyltransferase family 1 protein [Planctomycetes bacterium]|nr:glycosyltransferase family 1 protein [Planctomycetota bacterium]